MGSFPAAFVLPVRVEFDEVDLYGIVHHARYFVFMERARVAWFRALGVPAGSLAERGFGLVLVEDRTRYARPARFGDELEVAVAVAQVGAASLRLSNRITRGEDVVVESEIRLACIGADGRPRPFPATFRGGLVGS